MEKPTIIVAGNYRFTDEELFEISDSIPSAFEVKTHRAEEFQADELLPILQFFFVSITVGYLAAIGKDLWKVTKNTISSIINAKTSKCDVEFRFQEQDRKISFRCRATDSTVFESAFDKVIDTVKSAGFRRDEYEFNPDKNEWEEL